MKRLAEWLDAGAQMLCPTILRNGLPEPGEWQELPDVNTILVEVPGDFFMVRDSDMGLATKWRSHFRDVCEAAFAAGYAATRYLSEKTDEGRRNYYVFRRGIDLHALAGGYDSET